MPSHVFRNSKSKTMMYAMAIIFGMFAFASADEHIDVIPTPSILVAPIFYDPLEEILYIEGKSKPHAAIDLLFEASGAQPVRVAIKANSNGEWFFAEKLELADGEWMVRARAIASAPSDWSAPRLMRAKHSGFYIGSIKIVYLPTILGLLAVMIVSIAFFVYALVKVRAAQRLALAQEVRKNVEHHFTDLQHHLAEEFAHLEEGQSKTNESTKEKATHQKHFLEELRDTEASVEKQIKEIL